MSLTKITFYGELAEDLGQSQWKLAVDSPSEAMMAVDVLSGGKLLKHLYAKLSSPYRIIVNGKDIEDLREISLRYGKLESVEVIPVLRGSGMGEWLAIIGLLIIVSAFTFGAASGPSTAAVFGLTKTATFFLMLGVTLTLSGIAALLSPSPKVDTGERPENKPSYVFNGPVNTYRQGNPVPVGYGLLRIGSQVISAGIKSIDLISDSTPFDPAMKREEIVQELSQTPTEAGYGSITSSELNNLS